MLQTDGDELDSAKSNPSETEAGDVDASQSGSRSAVHAPGSNSTSSAELDTSAGPSGGVVEQALEWDSSFDYVRYQSHQQSSASSVVTEQGARGTATRLQTPALTARTDQNLVVTPPAGDSARSERTDSTVITIRRQVSFPTINLKRTPGALDGLRGLTIVFENVETAGEEATAADTPPRARSEASFCSLVATEHRRACRVSQNTEYASLSDPLSSASATSRPQPPPATPPAAIPAMPRTSLTGPAPPSIEKCARWLARHQLSSEHLDLDLQERCSTADVPAHGNERTRAEKNSRPHSASHWRQNQLSLTQNRRSEARDMQLSTEPRVMPSKSARTTRNGREQFVSEHTASKDSANRPGTRHSNLNVNVSQSSESHWTNARSSHTGFSTPPEANQHVMKKANPPASIHKSQSAPAGTVQQRPWKSAAAAAGDGAVKSRSAHAGTAAGLSRHVHATKLAESGRSPRPSRLCPSAQQSRTSSAVTPSPSVSTPRLPSLSFLDSAESDELIRRWRQDRKDFYQLAYLWRGVEAARQLPSTGEDSGFSSSTMTQRASTEHERPVSPPVVQIYTATVSPSQMPPAAAKSTMSRRSNLSGTGSKTGAPVPTTAVRSALSRSSNISSMGSKTGSKSSNASSKGSRTGTPVPPAATMSRSGHKLSAGSNTAIPVPTAAAMSRSGNIPSTGSNPGASVPPTTIMSRSGNISSTGSNPGAPVQPAADMSRCGNISSIGSNTGTPVPQAEAMFRSGNLPSTGSKTGASVPPTTTRSRSGYISSTGSNTGAPVSPPATMSRSGYISNTGSNPGVPVPLTAAMPRSSNISSTGSKTGTPVPPTAAMSRSGTASSTGSRTGAPVPPAAAKSQSSNMSSAVFKTGASITKTMSNEHSSNTAVILPPQDGVLSPQEDDALSVDLEEVVQERSQASPVVQAFGSAIQSQPAIVKSAISTSQPRPADRKSLYMNHSEDEINEFPAITGPPVDTEITAKPPKTAKSLLARASATQSKQFSTPPPQTSASNTPVNASFSHGRPQMSANSATIRDTSMERHTTDPIPVRTAVSANTESIISQENFTARNRKSKSAFDSKVTEVHFSPSTHSHIGSLKAQRSSRSHTQSGAPPAVGVNSNGKEAPRLDRVRSTTFTLSENESNATTRRHSALAAATEQAHAQPSPRSVSSRSASESRARSSSRSSTAASSSSLSSPRRPSMPAASPRRPSSSPNVRPSTLLRKYSGRGRTSAATVQPTGSSVQTADGTVSRTGNSAHFSPASQVNSVPSSTTRGQDGGRSSGTVTLLSSRKSLPLSTTRSVRAAIDPLASGHRYSRTRSIPQASQPLSVERQPSTQPTEPASQGYGYSEHPSATPIDTRGSVAAQPSLKTASSQALERTSRVSRHLDVVIQPDDDVEAQDLIEQLGQAPQLTETAVQTTAVEAESSRFSPSRRDNSNDCPSSYFKGGSTPQGQGYPRGGIPPQSPPRPRRYSSTRPVPTERRLSRTSNQELGRQTASRVQQIASSMSSSRRPSQSFSAGVLLPDRQALNRDIESSSVHRLRSVSRERPSPSHVEYTASQAAGRSYTFQTSPVSEVADVGTFSGDETEPDAVYEVEQIESDEEVESPHVTESSPRRTRRVSNEEDRLPPIQDTIRDIELRSRSASRERIPSPAASREMLPMEDTSSGPRQQLNIPSPEDVGATSVAENIDDEVPIGEDLSESVSGRRGSFRHKSNVDETDDSVEYQPGYWREFDGESTAPPKRRPPRRSRIPVRQVSREGTPRSYRLPQQAGPRYAAYEMEMEAQQRRAGDSGRRSVFPPMRRNEGHGAEQSRFGEHTRRIPEPIRWPHPWPPPQNDPVPSIDEMRDRPRPHTAPVARHATPSDTSLPRDRPSCGAGRGGRTSLTRPPTATPTTPRWRPRPRTPTSARSAASSRATAGTARSGGAASASVTPRSERSAGSGGGGFCTLGYSEAELLQARLVRRRAADGRPLSLRLDAEATFDGGRAVVGRLNTQHVADGHTQTEQISSLLQLDVFGKQPDHVQRDHARRGSEQPDHVHRGDR